jgi:hypothetical protein
MGTSCHENKRERFRMPLLRTKCFCLLGFLYRRHTPSIRPEQRVQHLQARDTLNEIISRRPRLIFIIPIIDIRIMATYHLYFRRGHHLNYDRRYRGLTFQSRGNRDQELKVQSLRPCPFQDMWKTIYDQFDRSGVCRELEVSQFEDNRHRTAYVLHPQACLPILRIRNRY